MTTTLTAIAQFTQEVLSTDKTGHGYDHIKRVVAHAQRILANEPSADAFIVLSAAYLHDTYDDKLFPDVAQAKNRVADFLTQQAVSPTQQAAIFNIIDNMSWSKQQVSKTAQTLDLNGQIVQDADRLEAVGAIAIVRTIIYGTVHDRQLYNPDLPPLSMDNMIDYRDGSKTTTINHIPEKLLHIQDHLNTTTAKELAKDRHDFTEAFYQQFIAEWHGER